jgi:hypothetical protein
MCSTAGRRTFVDVGVVTSTRTAGSPSMWRSVIVTPSPGSVPRRIPSLPIHSDRRLNGRAVRGNTGLRSSGATSAIAS